jgi:hypothetical protein
LQACRRRNAAFLPAPQLRHLLGEVARLFDKPLQQGIGATAAIAGKQHNEHDDDQNKRKGFHVQAVLV